MRGTMMIFSRVSKGEDNSELSSSRWLWLRLNGTGMRLLTNATIGLPPLLLPMMMIIIIIINLMPISMLDQPVN